MLMGMNRRVQLILILAMTVMMGVGSPAYAIDEAHRKLGEATVKKTIAYLKQTQNPDGSWSPKMGPAVTGLIVTGMLKDMGVDKTDPVIVKGVKYILSRQRKDGGIYDSILANYNTSICLMALGQLRGDKKIDQAIKRAQTFVKNLQWSNGMKDADGKTIAKGHPWFGGAGYGNKGRPDLSNTAMMIAGLKDSGLDTDDPAYKKALAFITQLQGTEANKKNSGAIEKGGGFIYASSTNKKNIGKLQSYAVPDRVTDASGRSRLRAYGSMTYAGFMSYLYADLDKKDKRVRDAFGWITSNYDLSENPGTGMQGYYYYLHMFSRAMSAWGANEIKLANGKKVDWKNDLIKTIAKLQRKDGSFLNSKDRWSEGDPNLCAGYCLLALQHALR